MGAGIVVMVPAVLVIAFSSPTLMFVDLGGGFLAGSHSVLA
jgi:hypothetical protein